MRVRKLDNKGLTLVELIVVIMILAILVGTSVISVSIIHDANVKSASESMMAMLNSARKTSIAKDADSVVLKLSLEDGKYYARILHDDDGDINTDMVILDERKIGSDAITVTIVNEDPIQPDVVLSEGGIESVEFHYNKSNGSLKDAYSGITLEGSDKYEIVLIRETGRCVLNETTDTE